MDPKGKASATATHAASYDRYAYNEDDDSDREDYDIVDEAQYVRGRTANMAHDFKRVRRSSSKMLRSLAGLDIDDMEFLGDMDHGASAKEEKRFVFEIAWEVANKGRQTFV